MVNVHADESCLNLGALNLHHLMISPKQTAKAKKMIVMTEPTHGAVLGWVRFGFPRLVAQHHHLGRAPVPADPADPADPAAADLPVDPADPDPSYPPYSHAAVVCSLVVLHCD